MHVSGGACLCPAALRRGCCWLPAERCFSGGGPGRRRRRPSAGKRSLPACLPAPPGSASGGPQPSEGLHVCTPTNRPRARPRPCPRAPIPPVRAAASVAQSGTGAVPPLPSPPASPRDEQFRRNASPPPPAPRGDSSPPPAPPWQLPAGYAEQERPLLVKNQKGPQRCRGSYAPHAARRSKPAGCKRDPQRKAPRPPLSLRR